MSASQVTVSQSIVDDANWWADHLVCPGCHGTLHSQHCPTCKRSYDSHSGTPCLKADDLVCAVQFEFTSARSFTPDDELLQTFGLPPPGMHNTGALPHHLDASHAATILQLSPGSRVLEIGCGGGQARKWYIAHGFQYVGTDVSKTRVFEWLQEFGGPDVLCDAHFLPFADDSFDLVYCAAVFEHLACPVLAAQEVRRVLKRGGLFLGNASFLEPWHDRSYFHMSPLGAFELLTAAGLTVRSIWPGRGYSGFRAISVMTLRPGLRWIGELGHIVYRVQNVILASLRRIAGKSAKASILIEGTVAGAIDWIAVKP